MSATTQTIPDPVQSAFADRLQRNDETVLRDILQSFGPATEARLRKCYPFFQHQDFEDVLAEALYQLWKDRHKYDPRRASLHNWFHILAKSKAEDVRKSKGYKAKDLECSADVTGFAVFHDDDAEDGAVTPLRVEQQDLLDILRDLPDEERRIIGAYANADGAEAWAATLAKELGVSSGLVRVKRLRIEKKIRREMQKRGHILTGSGR
ncbi:MAG TPA: sigma-70 family RNA polymerase sigma factor [Gemmataceae bacterium]|nr:sigma-70 family RNA polymerase sigma factor [Gemmataceae bacterium]